MTSERPQTSQGAYTGHTGKFCRTFSWSALTPSPFPQVPPGGRIHRHHPGREVPEGSGSAGPVRRTWRRPAGPENRAHGERNRAVLVEGQRHDQVRTEPEPEIPRTFRALINRVSVLTGSPVPPVNRTCRTRLRSWRRSGSLRAPRPSSATKTRKRTASPKTEPFWTWLP